MGNLGYYNNSFFDSIYGSILISKVAHTLYLGVCFRKVGIEKSILALVVLKVVGISSLVCVGLIDLKDFYKKVFRQRLVVII